MSLNAFNVFMLRLTVAIAGNEICESRTYNTFLS